MKCEKCKIEDPLFNPIEWMEEWMEEWMDEWINGMAGFNVGNKQRQILMKEMRKIIVFKSICQFFFFLSGNILIWEFLLRVRSIKLSLNF